VFWGGDTFAPKLVVNGESIQQYLQNKFLNCWKVVAEAVGDLDAVIGFDVSPSLCYVSMRY
jgi:hypothetical protein